MRVVSGVVAAGMLLVTGVAGAMGQAVAERGEGRAAGARDRAPGQYLKRLDANGDMAVTLEEFLKRRTARFAKLDKNADGAIDEAELAASTGERGIKRQERLLKRLDQDADGRLTKAEFDRRAAGTNSDRAGAGRFAARNPERRARMFTLMDRNGDGVVEPAEFETTRAEQAEYGQRRAMHVLDRNADGRITLEEYTADARARFVRLDLDRDGKITAPDLPPEARAAWTTR